jgi:hypothetical protein
LVFLFPLLSSSSSSSPSSPSCSNTPFSSCASSSSASIHSGHFCAELPKLFSHNKQTKVTTSQLARAHDNLALLPLITTFSPKKKHLLRRSRNLVAMPLSAKQMEYLALAVCHPPIHTHMLTHPQARQHLEDSNHTQQRYNIRDPHELTRPSSLCTQWQCFESEPKVCPETTRYPNPPPPPPLTSTNKPTPRDLFYHPSRRAKKSSKEQKKKKEKKKKEENPNRKQSQRINRSTTPNSPQSQA